MLGKSPVCSFNHRHSRPSKGNMKNLLGFELMDDLFYKLHKRFYIGVSIFFCSRSAKKKEFHVLLFSR